MNVSTLIQLIGAILFALAFLHAFSTKFFEPLAHTRPRHAGVWHLLGEVEVVFGFWAVLLTLLMFAVSGREDATAYLGSREFTEPMFVFAMMVIGGTVAAGGVTLIANAPSPAGAAILKGKLFQQRNSVFTTVNNSLAADPGCRSCVPPAVDRAPEAQP